MNDILKHSKNNVNCKKCIHYNICYNESRDDPAMIFCADFLDKEYVITIDEASELTNKIYECPCNSSYAEEYLPYVCDHKDTCNCSNVECWVQYFKHFRYREGE